MASVGWFMPARITPNEVTIFRFVAIPFVLYFLLIENYTVASVIFIIAAYSDAVDGAMARTSNRITDWGTLYDPLADKLLIGITSAILVSQFVSVFLAASIVIIELTLILNAIYYKRYKAPLSARFPGKAKMVCQSVGLIFLFIFIITQHHFWLVISTYTLIFALIFAFVSLLVYRSV